MATGNAPRIYSIETETANGSFETDTLRQEVTAETGVLTSLVRVRSGGGQLELYGATIWTDGEIPSLDAVVLAHTGATFSPPREVSAVADAQTTAASDVLMDSMAITPGAGSYFARFSTSVENSKNNAKTFVSLYAAGVKIPHTQRHSRRGGRQGNVQDIIATHALVQNLNDGETIEVRWRVSTGTAIAHERALLLQDA